MDRIEVELSESPAVPSDDTNCLRFLRRGIPIPVEHLRWGRVAQGLLGSTPVRGRIVR